MPEIAAAYAIGLIASALLTALHAFLFRRKMISARMRTVQKNLAKLNLFWSDSESRIETLKTDSLEKDRANYYRTLLRMGILFFFMSWVGFFLQLLIMVSVRFIAMPRLERAVFSSKLAEENIAKEIVRGEVDSIRERFRSYGTGDSSKS